MSFIDTGTRLTTKWHLANWVIYACVIGLTPITVVYDSIPHKLGYVTLTGEHTLNIDVAIEAMNFGARLTFMAMLLLVLWRKQLGVRDIWFATALGIATAAIAFSAVQADNPVRLSVEFATILLAVFATFIWNVREPLVGFARRLRFRVPVTIER